MYLPFKVQLNHNFQDMRSKWKGSQELREKLAAAGPSADEVTEEREPIIEGFVPDYDLRLFREAQALAAIKIEEELGDIPTDRGTRYVVLVKRKGLSFRQGELQAKVKLIAHKLNFDWALN